MSLMIGREMDVLDELEIRNVPDRCSIPPTPPPMQGVPATGYRFLRHFADSAMHTFILSVFESVFFWTYISKEEDAAFLRNLVHLRALLTVLCTDSDVDKLIEAGTLETNTQFQDDNNLALMYTSCYLSFALLALTLLATYISSRAEDNEQFSVITHLGWARETMRSARVSILPLSMIGLYEVIFFQTVVRSYMPISTETIYMELFGACVA